MIVCVPVFWARVRDSHWPTERNCARSSVGTVFLFILFEFWLAFETLRKRKNNWRILIYGHRASHHTRAHDDPVDRSWARTTFSHCPIKCCLCDGNYTFFSHFAFRSLQPSANMKRFIVFAFFMIIRFLFVWRSAMESGDSVRNEYGRTRLRVHGARIKF